MTRYLHIGLTALLVAVHALIVPWHVVAPHGLHEAHHEDEMEAYVVECAAQRPVLRSRVALPEMFDASCCSASHQHEVYAHSVTDHGFVRTRGEDMPAVPVVALPLVLQVGPQSVALPMAATESPPPKAPCLAVSFLRGPPVC